MGSRSLVVACVLGLATACGAPAPRWSPPADLSADDAVLYVSSDCNAVLVGPTTALTAAHCVEEPEPLHVRVGARVVPVTRCDVHPRAYAEPRPCGAGPGRTELDHDLALLTLAEPVGVAPVPVLLAEPALRPGWWRDLSVRLVGWDRRPRFVGPLARRSGDNQIVDMRRGVFVTAPVGAEGFRTIVGDSGGPALIRVGGIERVAGVLRGGPSLGSPRSVYAATFEPDNARWLVDVLPREVTLDLPEDGAGRFGR
ncbi:MAG: trypsin-like serine protease [Sandaracinaceae bacterium]|nr:trypsin-like serine protease [Sandaracinaceae bacterium]